MRFSLRFVLLILILCAAPSQAELKPDIVVASDGTGDFTSVQNAVESIPAANRERMLILIKDGVYREKVRIDASNVTLRGQTRAGSRIEYPQLDDDFVKAPDRLGRAVVNVNGSDVVLENLTIANTAGVVGPHAFAVSGTGDRVVITDSDVLSDGADTVALGRGKGGRYFHARCAFSGSVDFVCPRGWCYIVDSSFYEMKKTAAIWHDGHVSKDMKFVLRNCKFDGVDGFNLARHHHDAQFYLLDCTFSKAMIEKAPFRVIYPLAGDVPTTQDSKRNEELNNTNLWGERAYFFNCHREGGNYPWFKNNLDQAPGAPAEDQITAKWTFDGTWDPQNKVGPAILKVNRNGGNVELNFSENVTVKGKPRMIFNDGTVAEYISGSAAQKLLFSPTGTALAEIKTIDLNGGAIIASEAGETIRHADLALPMSRE